MKMEPVLTDTSFIAMMHQNNNVIIELEKDLNDNLRSFLILDYKFTNLSTNLIIKLIDEMDWQINEELMTLDAIGKDETEYNI
jgi:hypothetical protein